MKTRILRGLLVIGLLASVNLACAQGTAFTYHGQLNDNGSPAHGSYDLTFSVFDADTGTNQVGATVTNTALHVASGLFTATLDFGDGIFTGPERWLEIGVGTNGAGDFTTLSPRQRLTPTPYAIMANTASNLLGTLPAGQLSGTLTNGQLPANLARLEGDATFTGAQTFINPSNSFTGSGAGLTGLNPANLTPGTAGINISGNAATATSAAIAATASNFTGPVAGDVSGTQNATEVQRLRGVLLAPTAPLANQHLRYDGSQWTPGSVALETDVSGTLADARLSTNVALLDARQTFTGSNLFSGVMQLTNTDNTLAGRFSGDGNNLTGINPTNLAPGTASISITGHAATATSATTATTAGSATAFTGPLAGDVTGSQSSTLVATVGGQSAAQVASGVVAANAATAANTPDSIVKRDSSGSFTAGAIIAMSVSGEGSGLTALNASALTSGTLSDERLSTNAALLDADQAFTGSNLFSGVVQLTNTDNIFSGTFAGEGSSLTGLNPANLSVGTASIDISGNATSATTASSAPWSGITGIPTGFADGLDNDTLYSAGLGLNLTGTVFSVHFAGSGLVDSAARSDHDHNSLYAALAHNHDATYSLLGHGHTAADITSGTVPDQRLSANVPLLNAHQTFSGSNLFSGVVQLTNTSNSFAGSGAGLTDLSAGSLTSGTIPDSRLSPNVALLISSPTFAGTVSASSFAGSGNGLSNLNASSMTGLLTVKDMVALGHTNNGGSARGLAVAGQYAYLANETDGLRIYDISDPAHPINIGHTNNGGNAWAVAVAGGYAYLANFNDGLRIYNVSNPDNPINVGNIDNGGEARGVAVAGQYAYVANYDDGLRIYSITNPANPINVGHTNNGGLALGVAVSGQYAYLANDADGLRIYDISNPANPINVGHADDGGMAKGVTIAGQYVFLANGDDGLRIYNVSDPANPVSLGHIDDGGQGRAVAVSGSYAYLANLDDGLRVYDISNPSNPISVGHFDAGGLAQGVTTTATYAFLANGDDGLRCYALGRVVSPAFAGDGSGLTSLDASGLKTGTLPAGRFAGVYFNQLAFTNPSNSYAGNGGGLTNIDADTLGGLAASEFWQVGGNAGTTAGLNFIGTTDNEPLEFRVNNIRALRLEPTANGGPNVIGGAPINAVKAGVVGATISGGSNNVIELPDSYPPWMIIEGSTIGGGIWNRSSGQGYNTISGGRVNRISRYSSFDNSIGGGSSNYIYDFALGSTIAGGVHNTISDTYNAIGGGKRNLIDSGFGNSIPGGSDNRIGIWNLPHDGNSIGGGRSNYIVGVDSTIGGGNSNVISLAYSWPEGTSAGTIAGGKGNTISASAQSATIGGGQGNRITGSYSIIPGGFSNSVASSYSLAAGRRAKANHQGSFIWADSTDADFESAAADQFAIRARGGVRFETQNLVAGGSNNRVVDNSTGNFIGGGDYNTVRDGFGTIGGGSGNNVSVGFGTVAGGLHNSAAGDASVGGGDGNSADGGGSTIGGGNGNHTTGMYATVPGGYHNTAATKAFAAGFRARADHQGAFVWADSIDADFPSSATNEVSFRCNGGVRFTTGGAGVNETVSWTPGSASWSFTSDRNTKEGFADVNSKEVLEKVARLPIAEWNYKGHSQRHIGPMAQDFHALFPFNESETTLNSADLDGVALAAIQGLNQKLTEELKQKEAEIQSLQKRLEVLERAILGRETAQSGGGQ